jgi:hypothetical protein
MLKSGKVMASSEDVAGEAESVQVKKKVREEREIGKWYL